MSEFTDWENRMAALPFERRAVEADCPGCGSTNLERGKDWIRCKPCHTKTYFEPDDPPTDTDRIAAAVAVLREYNAITQNSHEPIRRVITILEGREVLNNGLSSED